MSRPVPRLHLIGPLAIALADYPRIAGAAARGGCDGIHLRLPGGAAADLLSLARTIRDTIPNASLIVNDRVDVALVAGADGVQLAERAFSVEDARRILPDDVMIGRSVHDVAGARVAADAGADYALAGHVFDTPSKDGTPGRGLDWLAAVAASVSIPVIALGGISVERIPAVIDAGAYGVALGRELLLAHDPETTARAAASRLRTNQ